MDKRCMSKIVLNKHVSVNTCSTCYYVLFVHFMNQNTEVHFDNSVTCSIYHYRKNRSSGGGEGVIKGYIRYRAILDKSTLHAE